MNTNLKRKRKSNRLTLGVITALGGLSLLAVGFSTWTFAIKQESDGFTISMQINEAFNGTIIKRSNVDLEDITIGYVKDESESTGSVAGDSSDQDGELSTNMQISTSVIVSYDTADILNEINGIEVSMGFYESTDTTQKYDKNKVEVKTATTDTKDAFGRTSGYYQYLKLPYNAVTITPQYAPGSQTEITGYTADVDGDDSYTVTCELSDYKGASGYKEAKFTLVDFDISYSDYFGNTAPELFYSDFIDNKKKEVLADRNSADKLNAYLDLISSAKAELEKMKEVLEKTTLHVNINVTTTSDNTN